MYRALQTFLVALCLLVSCLATGLRAQEDIRPLVDALGATAFPQKIEAVKALGRIGQSENGRNPAKSQRRQTLCAKDRRPGLSRRPV